MTSPEYEAWWRRVVDTPHMVWCIRVAGIAVATLAHAKLLPEENVERATKIVAEEIFIRMVANDLPPAGRP